MKLSRKAEIWKTVINTAALLLRQKSTLTGAVCLSDKRFTPAVDSKVQRIAHSA
jgi:hypothetical protein